MDTETDRLERRCAYERQHGLTCHQLLEFRMSGHPDIHKYWDEIRHRKECGLWYSEDEERLAIHLIGKEIDASPSLSFFRNRLTKWSAGRPPSLGWFMTVDPTDFRSYRWWNGLCWSMGAQDFMNDKEASAKSRSLSVWDPDYILWQEVEGGSW